ncbi:MAG: hypothetical protein MJZ12_00190 [Prevotella sp.]|nr:hypothetical protein [Prevotella sp.]
MRWIKLYDTMLDWEWSSDPSVFTLWVHLLLMANPEDRDYKGTLIPRGSLKTTVKELSDSTGLSVQQVRTAMKKLIATSNLTTKSTNKLTIVSVCGYESYQESFNAYQQAEQQTTQQTDNKQPKEKNQKKIIKKQEYKENTPKGVQKKVEELAEDAGKVTCKSIKKTEYQPGVKLTEEEYGRLCKEFTKEDTDGSIKFLSDYKIEKAYKTKDDNLTIRRWVMDAFRQKKTRTRPTTINEIQVNDLW